MIFLSQNLYAVNGARVYNSTNQTCAINLAVILSFNSERFDTNNYHNASNPTRFTITDTGIYYLTANTNWSSGAWDGYGQRNIGLRINGGTRYAGYVTETPVSQFMVEYDYKGHTTAGIVRLNTGDYVEVRVWQSSHASLNVLATSQYTPEFSITRLE